MAVPEGGIPSVYKDIQGPVRQFIIWIVVMVSQLRSYVKTHPIAGFNYVQLIVRQQHSNTTIWKVKSKTCYVSKTCKIPTEIRE